MWPVTITVSKYNMFLAFTMLLYDIFLSFTLLSQETFLPFTMLPYDIFLPFTLVPYDIFPTFTLLPFDIFLLFTMSPYAIPALYIGTLYNYSCSLHWYLMLPNKNIPALYIHCKLIKYSCPLIFLLFTMLPNKIFLLFIYIVNL